MIEVNIVVVGGAVQELTRQEGAADWFREIRRKLGGDIMDKATIAMACLPLKGEDWRGREFGAPSTIKEV